MLMSLAEDEFVFRAIAESEIRGSKVDAAERRKWGDPKVTLEACLWTLELRDYLS